MGRIIPIISEMMKYFKIRFELGQDDDPNTKEEPGLLATIKVYKK